MTSNADNERTRIYSLVEDFTGALIMGAAFAGGFVLFGYAAHLAVGVSLLATATYFAGQRLRRARRSRN